MNQEELLELAVAQAVPNWDLENPILYLCEEIQPNEYGLVFSMNQLREDGDTLVFAVSLTMDGNELVDSSHICDVVERNASVDVEEYHQKFYV